MRWVRVADRSCLFPHFGNHGFRGERAFVKATTPALAYE
jgi:hypothetical protein